MRRRWVFILPLLLLLAYLATGLYQVEPGEAAVVFRFGRLLPDPSGPGLHYGLPWGFDRVVRVAVPMQRKLTVGFVLIEDPRQDRLPVGQVLTGDNHLVNVRITVHYRVDANNVEAYVLHQDRCEQILARLAEESLVLAFTSENVHDVLFESTADLEKRLKAMLVSRLVSFPLGIVVDNINLLPPKPPEELKEAFDELTRARAQRDVLERETHARRDSSVSQAERQKVRTLTEARGLADKKIALVREEAKSFVALIKTLPKAGPARANALLNLYLNEMQAVFSRLKVRTISDPRGKQNLLVPFPGP